MSLGLERHILVCWKMIPMGFLSRGFSLAFTGSVLGRRCGGVLENLLRPATWQHQAAKDVLEITRNLSPKP